MSSIGSRVQRSWCRVQREAPDRGRAVDPICCPANSAQMRQSQPESVQSKRPHSGLGWAFFKRMLSTLFRFFLSSLAAETRYPPPDT